MNTIIPTRKIGKKRSKNCLTVYLQVFINYIINIMVNIYFQSSIGTNLIDNVDSLLLNKINAYLRFYRLNKNII